jgi:GTP pyrophosphokinase
VSLLPKTTLDYFNGYQERFSEYEKAAKEAEEFVDRALQGAPVRIQSISARAKAPYSLLDKLRRKEYSDPAADVKDLIGVRVVTHYPDEAERAADILKPLFTVDDKESYDRLSELEPQAFGYRSIHLVVQLHEDEAGVSKTLGSNWFEIQVRSLLQHAWATIEHEVQYKAGIDLPDWLVRRLAGVAGSLETLDHSFIGIRTDEDGLIDEYRHGYLNGEGSDETFDVARLTGCMEVLRPEGGSLRNIVSPLAGPSVHIGKLLKDALAMVGITTRGQLEKALERKSVRELLKEHASAVGATVDTLSHLVVCLVVVWSENQEVLIHQFPELCFDLDLLDTLGIDS